MGFVRDTCRAAMLRCRWEWRRSCLPMRKLRSCGWGPVAGFMKRSNEDRSEAYTSDRHLRHRDGVAGGDAATAGAQHDWFGCRGVSADVRFAAVVGNPGDGA